MKSKTLKRVRRAIERYDLGGMDRQEDDAFWGKELASWKRHLAFWTTCPRHDEWTEEKCSRLADNARMAVEWIEGGRVGEWPNMKWE